MGLTSFRAAGRMGNFLFEAAASYGYARKHGLEWSVPSQSSHPFWSPLYLQHLVHPNYKNIEDILINEGCHEYQELPYDKSWKDKFIVLNGYFQTEKYFKDYKDEIIELFAFPYEFKEGVCSIHARFGDYLTIQGKHIIVDTDYLIRAMSYIYSYAGIERFKVFSDDINYFKSNFGHIYDFEYSTNGSIEADLIEISCCEHNINSSSTFSWWSAYLNRNPNKIIVTQERWFQDGWGGLNTNDIIPENWIKL